MTAELPVPVGRVRRYAGYACYAYGFLLCLRMAWMTFFYHPVFGEIQWIRTTVLFWFGLELVLLGCWLVFRSRWAIVAAVAITVILVALATIQPFPTLEPQEVVT